MFDFISQGCAIWGVNTLKVYLIQNALCSWQVLGWSGFLEADILISLFTLLIFPPLFPARYDCLAFCAMGWGVMKGDNASWLEDIDFSFLLSRSLYSLPCWRFSHFYLFHFWSISLFVSISLPALLSPFISIFSFICSTLHLHTLIVSLVLSQIPVQWWRLTAQYHTRW